MAKTTTNKNSTDEISSTVNKHSTVLIYNKAERMYSRVPVRSEKNRRYAVHKFTKTLTKQSFRDECNVNSIMARYQNTGMVDHLNKRQPEYLDVSSGVDYREALERIRNAQELFNELPAIVRKRFDNDPSAFADFAENPENIATLVANGLAVPREPLYGDLDPDTLNKSDTPEKSSQASTQKQTKNSDTDIKSEE